MIAQRHWKKLFWFALALKIVALVVFIYIHQTRYSHYQPDFLLIFQDASHLAEVFYRNPLHYCQILWDAPETHEQWYLSTQPRAFFTAKIFSIPTIILYKNFWLVSLAGSLWAFWGMWQLVKVWTKYYPNTHLATWIAFLGVPSVLFWSSATSKESILIGCIGWSMATFFKGLYEPNTFRKIKYGLIFLLNIIVLWKIKYYYAFGLLLSLVLYGYGVYAQKYNLSIKRHIVALFLVFLGFVSLSFLHPNMVLSALPEALYNNHILTIEASSEKAVIKFFLEPTWLSIIQNSPKALYVGLFSPMLWESYHTLTLIASVENSILLILFLLSVKKYITTARPIDTPLLMMLCTYIVLMATFLALSSPNFGALSRYRCGFTPFLWYVIWVILLTKKPSLFNEG
jgi:hypothetical protein